MENYLKEKPKSLITEIKDNYEDQIYLDFLVKENTNNTTIAEGNQSEDKSFFFDDIDWDDALLDKFFEVDADELQALLKTNSDPLPIMQSNSSDIQAVKLESNEDPKPPQKKNKKKSAKVVPVTEADPKMITEKPSDENENVRCNEKEDLIDEDQEKKRRYWRDSRLKKVKKKLIVSEDDFRRVYMKNISHLFNSNQLEKLRQYLGEHCDVENVTYRQTISPQADANSSNMFFYFMPSFMEIRGLDNYIKFCQGLIAAAPDFYFHMSNIIIRNRSDGSMIMADFEVGGTPTFHLLVKNILKSAFTSKKNVNEEELEKKKRKRDKVVKEIVITDITSNFESLNLSSDVEGDQPLEIVQGTVRNPKDISPYSGYGVIRYHLDKNQKHYLTEIELIKFVKTGEVDPHVFSLNRPKGSTIPVPPSNSIYRWSSNIGVNMSKLLRFKPKN